jgi:DNA polymerase III delta subunit
VASKSKSARKPLDIKKFIADRATPGPILLLGPDRYRIEELCSRIFKEWGVSIEDPSAVTPLTVKSLPTRTDSLRDTFCSISLFSSNSFFLLRGCHEISSTLGKALSSVLAELPQGVGVVLIGERLPGTSTLKKLAAKQGWLLELSELEHTDLLKWTTKELKKRGIPDIEPVALNTLVDISDRTLDSLATLIEHLALYLNATPSSPSSAKVRKQDILELFVEHPDPNEFSLVEIALSGNPAQIESQIRSLVAAGKSEFRLLGLISRALSQYQLVHSLKQAGKNDAQIRATLKLPPSIASKVAGAALRISPERLRLAKQEVVRADGLFKNRSLGTEIVLDNLCHRIGRRV